MSCSLAGGEWSVSRVAAAASLVFGKDHVSSVCSRWMMERWTSLSAGQKVAVTMGVSAGAVLLYACYTRYRTAPEHRPDKLQVTIPQYTAELIIGQDGAIADKLIAQSHAHIELTAAPDGRGDCELTVSGSPAQLRQARQRLHEILQDRAAVRVELHFPTRSMGRIIGQGGERIREITRSSGAKIHSERRTDDSQTSPTRRITVIGTRKQVEAAKTLLQKASEEEATVQRRAAESSTFRSRRKEIIAVKKKDRQRQEEEKQSPPKEAPQVMDPTEDRPSEDDSPTQENMADCPPNISKFEVPSPDFNFRADEYVNVFVSAAENPEHFWIQILGPRSLQLDKLTTEMSDHYRGRKRGAVSEIQVGDIVAAPFHVDEFWYRAEVLGFLKNGNVDLYYVDYGDNWDTAREELHPLRSDFLSLPFQAVECRLSGVAACGETWSDQALDAFDTLSHCAKWKSLLAKISSFPSPGVSRCFQIQLYDPSSDPMLDIGLELIRQGHAIKCQVSPTQGEEEESLVARLLEEVTSLSVRSDTGTLSSRLEEGSLASDGSIEMIRADVFPSPEPQQCGISTPTSFPESVDESDSLEQSVSKMHINVIDHLLTSTPSTAPSPKNMSSSATSSVSSGEVSSASSTCTAKEELSFVTSSGDSSATSSGDSSATSSGDSSATSSGDSSASSLRGCFYYLTESVTSPSGDIITISSDSEDDTVQTGLRKAARDLDTLLSSSGDIIVIEDES